MSTLLSASAVAKPAHRHSVARFRIAGTVVRNRGRAAPRLVHIVIRRCWWRSTEHGPRALQPVSSIAAVVPTPIVVDRWPLRTRMQGG